VRRLIRRGSVPWRTVAWVFAGWTVFGVLQALGLSIIPYKKPIPFWGGILPIHVILSWGLALATPAIVWLTRWTMRPGRTRRAAVAAHAAAALAAVVAYGTVHASLWALVFSKPLSRSAWAVTTIEWMDLSLVLYAAIAVVARAIDLRRSYTDRLRHTLALESDFARAHLQFLERQVQPHFLFNCLNAITELAHESPAAARRAVSHLQTLLRTASGTGERHEITLAEELTALAPYVEIQRVRFGEWLTVDWDIEPAARLALMPPFVLQPLVENAIRHGLAVRPGEGRVTIGARVSNGRLQVSVRDNGVGLAASRSLVTGRGIGLRNVRERLQSLYGDDATLELQSPEGNGANAELHIPYHRTPIEAVQHISASGRARNSAMNGTRRRELPESRLASPRITARAWAAIVVFWAALGVMWVSEPYFIALAWNSPDPMMDLRAVAGANFLGVCVWIVIMPAVVAATRWLRQHVSSVWVLALVHGCGAVAAAALQMILLAGLRLLPPSMPWYAQQLMLAWDLVAYGAIVAWAYGRDFGAWSREREMDGLRLEADIARARWQLLRVNLRPDEVCATLDRVAALVDADAASAERVAADLGDSLRERLHATHDGVPALTVS
jgi:two-component system LytT family sensor kinase